MRRLALLLTLVATGCGSSGPEVGKCTNQDPDLTVQVVELEVVDCDDGDATQRITKKSTQDGADCEQGRLTADDEVFCTEPK
jgi:hypothetical protein